jgi:hypothetical protein
MPDTDDSASQRLISRLPRVDRLKVKRNWTVRACGQWPHMIGWQRRGDFRLRLALFSMCAWQILLGAGQPLSPWLEYKCRSGPSTGSICLTRMYVWLLWPTTSSMFLACSFELLFSRRIIFFLSTNQHKHQYKSNFSISEHGDSRSPRVRVVTGKWSSFYLSDMMYPQLFGKSQAWVHACL